MRGEGERQSERRRELRTERARAEYPDRHVEPRTGNRPHELAGYRFREKALQLLHVLRESIGRHRISTQRAHRWTIGARRATESQIDPSREQRLESPELLGDHERRMVREHDAAGADPDARGAGCDMCDHHGGRRTGDPDHVVVLGEPVAVIAEPLGVPGQIERVAE